jgi:nucleotide-binding universal stress UspA family protein
MKEREMSGPITQPGIIVGVDGSPASNAAVGWAARNARRRNAALTVVHIVPAPAETWPGTPLPVGLATWQERRGNRILADAITIARESTEHGGRCQVNSELLVGSTVATLVDLSKEAELVVVGCRGLSGLSRVLLASVSSGLVRHAHCPVAVIHDEAALMPHPAQAPVVGGVDGSSASELATAVAFDEASRRGVQLIAVYAWSDVELSSSRVWTGRRSNLRKKKSWLSGWRGGKNATPT